jgi:iron complex outermembrane receptor protein
MIARLTRPSGRKALMRIYSLLRFLVTAVSILSPALAASLQGVVYDPAGKPIPQCHINIFARSGVLRISAVADGNGRYLVESLPAGQYLVQADAKGMTGQVAATVAETGATALDLKLSITEVRTQVLVTATGSAQSTDEIAKSVDSLNGADLARNAEYSVTESLRSLPGMRIQTLGGPGSFTRIVSRGLRPQDTAITVNGLRFRDAATTQGDATPFLQDMMLLGTERIEVLRGTGSSVYGNNAIAGVINLVTDTGGGPLHGEIKAEGGGLGMMRGLAKVGGGSRGGRMQFSAGAQSTGVLSGVDGNDGFRNHSVQGSVQFRPVSKTSLTTYLWAADSFAQVNSTPFAGPTASLPAGDIVTAIPVSLDVQHRIEAGVPVSYGGANFVPNLDDPDSRRASRFLSGALVWNQQIGRRFSYRTAYHRVVTNRRFDDGPAGVRFPPASSVSDRIRGGTDTVEARVDIEAAKWNVFTAGYEFERESYRSRHIEFPPAPATRGYFTAAGQRDQSVFFNDQFRLADNRLQIGLSGRLQTFALRAPEFAGGISRYEGITFQAPPRAKTGDGSIAYFVPASGTKLRAHVGNGYRSPSIFERFGSTFSEGFFASLGDPRLRPERTMAFDMGIDQYLLRQKLRVSGTWFYTNLQETLAFDSSGFLVPARDPFGRSSGYINSGGGIARGAELSAEASPLASLKVRAAYTYTNAEFRRSTTRDRDFFEIPFTSPHQFSLVATQRIGRRVDLVGDVWIANRHASIFSSRAFLFSGPRKVDLVANYTLPVGDRQHWRFYGKVSNILDSEYLEGGYRTPGRWGIGGVEFRF